MMFSFMKLNELIQILDITAHKWNLSLDKKSVSIKHYYGMTKEGYILQDAAGMLDPVQKVVCPVLENEIKKFIDRKNNKRE